MKKEMQTIMCKIKHKGTTQPSILLVKKIVLKENHLFFYDDYTEKNLMFKVWLKKKYKSIKKNIPGDKIKVAICYVRLRRTINTGKREYMFDDKQSAKSAFNTFTKKTNKILEWRKDPESFFKDLIEKEVKDDLWKAVVEQYKSESH